MRVLLRRYALLAMMGPRRLGHEDATGRALTAESAQWHPGLTPEEVCTAGRSPARP